MCAREVENIDFILNSTAWSCQLSSNMTASGMHDTIIIFGIVRGKVQNERKNKYQSHLNHRFWSIL